MDPLIQSKSALPDDPLPQLQRKENQYHMIHKRNRIRKCHAYVTVGEEDMNYTHYNQLMGGIDK